MVSDCNGYFFLNFSSHSLCVGGGWCYRVGRDWLVYGSKLYWLGGVPRQDFLGSGR
ncbi:unnamed protein product, partial [Vitis vinifera]|uniref:Uncharacterized protein n=1 Tax=Vitis vinifera TaxID=29760 RepID=D7SNI3_VITVI